jgi:2-methylcitrate dehydratase PrpD
MNDSAPRQVSQHHDHLTLKLVEHARKIAAGALPPDVRELAKQCVLDWTAVALAGSGDHLTRILLDDALSEGGNAVATVVGHAPRVTASQAALINGASSHVLDYDDVNLSFNGHPSAAILPAVLALGETRQTHGNELVDAFVAGYEIACRVGVLMAPGHYARGYHSTSTIGALGAAVACARLLKLDAERTAHAIGIAATQAGGLKAMFGTECKPFHAGMAAHNGLRAARLAAAGMIARPDALECRQGFAATMSPSFNPDAALAEPSRFYLRENLFKYHASCYGTHASIEGVRQLRETNALSPQDIGRVTLRVDKGSDLMCNIANPGTALEAKFSLRFMAAAALAGVDTSDLAFFRDETTGDAALCALRDTVSVELVSDCPLMQAEVTIETNDGRVLRAIHDAGLPGTDYALQARRLTAKFERLVEPVLGEARCGKLLHLIERLEQTPVADLMAATRRGS